jgi:hypothetical protein
MWIIHDGASVRVRANHPDHDILGILREESPAARILRATRPIINEVNALLFALRHVPGEPIEVRVPVLDEQGEPVLDEAGDPKVDVLHVPGPPVSQLAGNTPHVEGDVLIIRDPDGQELARYDLEVMCDPAA